MTETQFTAGYASTSSDSESQYPDKHQSKTASNDDSKSKTKFAFWQLALIGFGILILITGTGLAICYCAGCFISDVCADAVVSYRMSRPAQFESEEQKTKFLDADGLAIAVEQHMNEDQLKRRFEASAKKIGERVTTSYDLMKAVCPECERKNDISSILRRQTCASYDSVSQKLMQRLLNLRSLLIVSLTKLSICQLNKPIPNVLST